MAWPDLVGELTTRAEAITRPGASSPANAAWLTRSISDALALTKTTVQAALSARGYSGAQAESWASGPGRPVLLSIALYLVSCDSRLDLKAADEQRDSSPPAILDMRPQLATLAICDDNGDPVAPAALNPASSIAWGRVKSRGETFRNSDGSWKKW
jgi:hypothetical protein